MTDNEILVSILGELEERYRFSMNDNLLDNKPTDDEIKAAIWDAMGEINSAPPATDFDLKTMYDEHKDGNPWRTILYFGSAKNIIRLLMNHWNAEGFNANLGDLQAESKFGDFSSLYGTLDTEFNERLEKLKKSTQRHIKGISGVGMNVLVYPPYSNISRVYRRTLYRG